MNDDEYDNMLKWFRDELRKVRGMAKRIDQLSAKMLGDNEYEKIECGYVTKTGVVLKSIDGGKL